MSTLEEIRERIKANGPKEPFKLSFRQLTEYSLQCTCCGQFYVNRFGDPYVYEVWFKVPGKTALQLRTNLPTGADAKAWASSLAAAYKRGSISLNAPPSPQEMADHQAVINRLKAAT